jgi:hypothetical protein
MDNSVRIVETGKWGEELPCACGDCHCVELCIGAPKFPECGCCMADCPDVHPWNAIGYTFLDGVAPDAVPKSWLKNQGVEITKENAFDLGPTKKGKLEIGERWPDKLLRERPGSDRAATNDNGAA